MERVAATAAAAEALQAQAATEMAPEMALAMGQVDVDDLGQLMAFKMAFKLERELFDAYLTKVGVK